MPCRRARDAERDAGAGCDSGLWRAPRAGERRQAHRWGRTKGKIGFHGGKVEIERPRVRGLDGAERVLPSWENAVSEDLLGKWAMNQMLITVSMRRFKRSVRLPEGDVPASDGAGLSKSATSRRFVALSAARMKAWMESRLSLIVRDRIEPLHEAVEAIAPGARASLAPLSIFRNVTRGAKGATVPRAPPWGDQTGSITCGAIGWSGRSGGKRTQDVEETVTKETQSYIDMLRNFGTNFGLPQVDVEKLLETNRKNLEALGESAKVAAGGAQSVAQKQREILEASLREASALARGYQPMGNAQEILAKQTEFVKKVFDISVQGARDSAELATQSTGEAVKIIQERMKASLEEIRGSVSRQSGQARSETPKG